MTKIYNGSKRIEGETREAMKHPVTNKSDALHPKDPADPKPDLAPAPNDPDNDLFDNVPV